MKLLILPVFAVGCWLLAAGFLFISSPIFAQEGEPPPPPVVDLCAGTEWWQDCDPATGARWDKPCNLTFGSGLEFCHYQANGLTYNSISGYNICSADRDPGTHECRTTPGSCPATPACENWICNPERKTDVCRSKVNPSDPDPKEEIRKWSECDEKFLDNPGSYSPDQRSNPNTPGQPLYCAENVPIDPANGKYQSDWVCSDHSDDPVGGTAGVKCRRNYQAKIQFIPDPPAVGQNNQVRIWSTPSCKPQSPEDIDFKADQGFTNAGDFHTNCSLNPDTSIEPPVPPLISQKQICNNDVINGKKRTPDPFDNNSPLQCRWEGLCQVTRTTTDLEVEKYTAVLTIKITPTADYVGNGCSDTKDYNPKPYECNTKRANSKETILDAEWGAAPDVAMGASFDSSVVEGVWNKDTGDNKFKIERWSQALLPEQVNQDPNVHQDPQKCDGKEVPETGVQGGFLADLANKVLCFDTLKGITEALGIPLQFCRLKVNQGGDCSTMMQAEKGKGLAVGNRPSMAPSPAPKDCGLFDVNVKDNDTGKTDQTQGDRYLDLYSSSMGTKAGFTGSDLPVETLKDSITLDKRRNLSTQTKLYTTKNAQENYTQVTGQDGDWRIPDSECMDELFARGNYPEGIFPMTTPPPHNGADPENDRRKSACIKPKI